MSKKTAKDAYSEIDQIIDSEAFVECVKRGFKEVRDPRTEDNNSYPLVSLLVMVLCAIIAGANTITQIHEYVEIKIGLFQRLLGVERAPMNVDSIKYLQDLGGRGGFSTITLSNGIAQGFTNHSDVATLDHAE